MKKTIVFVLALALVLGNGFMMFEGMAANAGTVTSSGSNLSLSYPVEVTVDPEMSLNCETSTPVSLAGNINGMTGGTATGNRSCTAITNHDLGYSMTAAVTPMTDVLTGAHSFDAYTGATSSWTAVGTNASAFGLSSALTGWIGATSATTIYNTAVHTDLDGEDIAVNYEAQVGPGSIMPSGLYRATSTITMIMN